MSGSRLIHISLTSMFKEVYRDFYYSGMIYSYKIVRGDIQSKNNTYKTDIYLN